jgi:hypothetical protein
MLISNIGLYFFIIFSAHNKESYSNHSISRLINQGLIQLSLTILSMVSILITVHLLFLSTIVEELQSELMYNVSFFFQTHNGIGITSFCLLFTEIVFFRSSLLVCSGSKQ